MWTGCRATGCILYYTNRRRRRRVYSPYRWKVRRIGNVAGSSVGSVGLLFFNSWCGRGVSMQHFSPFPKRFAVACGRVTFGEHMLWKVMLLGREKYCEGYCSPIILAAFTRTE
jgi:hypothetical protein